MRGEKERDRKKRKRKKISEDRKEASYQGSAGTVGLIWLRVETHIESAVQSSPQLKTVRHTCLRVLLRLQLGVVI